MGRCMGLGRGTGCSGVDGGGDGNPRGDGGEAAGEVAGVCAVKGGGGEVVVVACRWPAVGVRQPAVAKFPAAAGMGLVLVGLVAMG
jgi:hypothetical protein